MTSNARNFKIVNSIFAILCTGFRNAMNDLTGKPELQLSGYAWNPYNLYRTGVPALTLYNPHNPWPKTGKSSFCDFHDMSSTERFCMARDKVFAT